MVDIQFATTEMRRGIKKRKKEEEERNHRAKIQWPALFHRAAMKTFLKLHTQLSFVKEIII